LLARDPVTAADRRVYLVDAECNLDDAADFEFIDDAHFTTSIASLREAVYADGTAMLLEEDADTLSHLQATHDARTHVLVWFQTPDERDRCWLIDRHPTTSPAANE
jgi:hypothetical protein